MATNNSTKFNIKHGAAGSLPTTKTNGTLYVATKDDKRAELHVDLNGERYVISESLPVDNVLKDNSTNPVQNKVVKDALTAIETTLSGKSDDDHTHNYAGSTSPGGDANAAKKLTTNAGSATQPVYFENGVPIATTYTLGKSVPSNAKFTDTNTKVTSVENHYTPSANANSVIPVAAPADTTASWGSTAVLTGFSVSRDAKGHVTDITPTGVKMPTNPNTNTTYDLSAPANKDDGNVTINLTAGGSGSGTDSVKIKGSGATSVTTNENGHIIISSTDTTYTHPSHTAKSNGFYKVTVDSLGHVSSTTKVAKADITALGIPSADTHYTSKNIVGDSTATSNTTSALTDGKVYLKHVENGAVTSTHKISGSGSTTVTTDTSGNIIVTTPSTIKNPKALTLKGNGTSIASYDGSAAKSLNIKSGNNITVTADTTNSAVTIAAKDTTYSLETPLNATNPDVSLSFKENGTEIKNIKIAGSGATSVITDESGNITVSSTDTTYTALKNPTSLTVKGNGTTSFSYDGSSAKTLNIKAGTNTSISSDTSGNITINSTNTTYDLSAPASKSNGSVTLDLKAGGSGTGTDSVTIKGTGATTVTTDEKGVVTVYSTDNNSAHGHSVGVGLTGSGNAGTSGTYTYKAKLRSETALTVDSAAATTTSGRVYPVAVDKTGYLAVNVPWTSKNIVGATSNANSNTTSELSDGNVYLNHVENGVVTSAHKISGSGATTVTTDTSGNIVISSTDTNTKNTAGSTNTSSKIFLIGATSQAANPQTYSHDTAYVGTDGCLYSGGKKVLTSETSLSKGTDTTATATIDGAGPSNNKKPTFTAVTDTAVSGHKITDTTTTYTLDLSDYVTSNELSAQLSTAMVFKGSLGTNGTITALPTASSSTIGDTYKVITAGTYASIAAKVGDVFICNNDPSWVLIPSGDEPSGTVTSIKVGGGLVGDGLVGGTITTSGEISHADTSSQLSIAASGRRYITGVALDTFGHVTGLTTGTETVTNTNTTYDFAASTSSTNGNVKLNLTAGGSGSGTDSVTIKGSGATTVTTDANGVVTIGSTDTTYGAAGSSLGLVKTGGDVTISSGVITVNDNSHNHSASNITSGTLAVDRGGTGITSNPSMLVNLASTSADTVFETSPRPGVTGTLPIANGGTGATTAAGALTNLGLTATAAELNYCDGVTSNIQTQLNNKMSARPTCIELGGSADDTLNEGFIDFHFNNSSADYTSRIIENASGTLDINGTSINSSKLTTPSITISSTSAVKHLAFSRGDFNYITTPASGKICFVTNGKTIERAKADLLIENGCVLPGATNATLLGNNKYR